MNLSDIIYFVKKNKIGISNEQIDVVCGWRTKAFHFFAPSGSNFRFVTLENYKTLQGKFPGYFMREYESLRREYESLRREYESLRYTFQPDEKVSSLWQFPPGKSSWHPTPKPEGLLRRIIYTTSNPDDVVYEPFAGTAAACKVAEKLGRRWVATDTDEKYVQKATEELKRVRGVRELFT